MEKEKQASTAPSPLSLDRSNTGTEPDEEESVSSCPICLGPIVQDSYLEKCLHKFCFHCIMQWTKVVARKHRGPAASSVKCPLCKADNIFIIHGLNGTVFQRYYVNEDVENSFILSREQRYRLQCYYTEPGNLDDIFNISRYWKSRKYCQPNRWLQNWLKREFQALLQEEDVEVLVHHIRGVISSSLSSWLKSPAKSAETIEQEFKNLVFEAARPFLVERTERFVYEMELFLASELNMEAYDAVYMQRLGWNSSPVTSETSERELSQYTTVVPFLYIYDEDSNENL